MSVHHIIFDCDGVLVDSEPLSMRADVALLRRFGVVLTEDEAHQRFVGKTFQAMLDMVTAEFGTAFPPGLHAEKNRLVEDLFRSDLKIVPGVAATLAGLRERGIGASIASNSPRARVALAVALTGIADQFSAITAVEDVARGKPAPDVFLTALERAGCAAGHCLVVEDSTTGVTAAVAAGLRTVGFVGTHPDVLAQAEALRGAGAVAVIRHMEDLLHHAGRG